MLASDLNNTDFVNARNPDSGLHVEFYWHEPVDAWASREASAVAQRNVVVKGPKQPFVRIMVPGIKETIWEESVAERHKQRFPQHWLAWQMAEGLIDGDGDIPGWKLSEWNELNEELVRELRYLRFQTVEQLAGANDKQIQGIGMGGVSLREKARVALRNRMGDETREALAESEKEKQELKARLERMEAMMAKMMPPDPISPDLIPPNPTEEGLPLVAPEKRAPGRPPKAEAAAI